MDQASLEAVLGRPEHHELIALADNELREDYEGKKVLITGGNGSLGQAVMPTLLNYGADVLTTDIVELDVRDAIQVGYTIHAFKPDYIFHFAAGKHAPVGEQYPVDTVETNIDGLKNVIFSSTQLEKLPRILFASTCKACDPETVYGSTKLIGERMALNYSEGSVARFFNVVQTQGNVFEIWDQVPDDQPIEVADVCNRYFVSVEEARALAILTATRRQVRYMLKTELRNMAEVAGALYPNRAKVLIPQRRGDRITEKYRASNEVDVGSPAPGIRAVLNYNDQA